ncbi:MAG: PhnD/SsuA/transferrin family substrate-binding protein [Piscinibacter sp.]|nr:PhnD/SsuA/transferrin family substrate-binding protein [Piscinibacter sp.]
MHRPYRRRSLLAAVTALAGGPALSFLAGRPAQAAAPLRIALAPFLSPTVLLAVHRRLREHLEQVLARPIEMVTAKDFRTLIEETRRGDHDIVQLPAHLARLAMLDWGFVQVAGTVQALDVLVVVKDGGPVREPADLRGRQAGMLDPLSLTATIGRRWLAEQGLTGHVTVLAQPSINSALYALDRDEVAMVVAGRTQLGDLPASTPRQHRVLATIGGIPGPVYVARPGLPADDVAAVRAAMDSFRPDPGRPISAPNSTPRPLDAETLSALDPLVGIARDALAALR